MNLLPIDYALAVYNLVLIGVWLPLAGGSDVARWMIGVHTVALTVPWLITRATPPLSSVTRLIREVYPVLWLIVFWRELGIHCGLVGSSSNDGLVALLDRAMFGANLNATWAPHMPAAWVSELMQGTYFLYYAMAVALVGYLAWRRDRAVTRDMVLRLGLTYAAAYVVYAIAPTVGPMAMPAFPRFAGPGAHGLFRTLNDWLQANGDAAGTAFPSTHVAGAVALAWLAWRHCPRWCAWAATGLAIAVGPATVYTQNHFSLDAVGGAVLGLSLQVSLVPTLLSAQRTPPHEHPALALARAEVEAA
jgi:membrane-associated phospholipid phosphatase